MINALEAVIQYLKQSGLSTAQIASKSHYGNGWDVGSSAVVVRLDGGAEDNEVPVQEPRLEIRCFAAQEEDALALMNEVRALSRMTNREDQTTVNGKALIYWLRMESGPSSLFDDGLNMPFALQFFSAKVSEEVVQ
ncbi:conserved hypothetical protein [Gammaproteobacteria bacterium]